MEKPEQFIELGTHTCDCCAFFVDGHGLMGFGDRIGMPDAGCFGECRRNPPGRSPRGEVGEFVVVHEDYWCGEWSRRRER